ncbi:hypothetical protein LOAG_00461 [Loa loa]|uniref:Lipid-binding serum glycoprotein N-terminal domain-containing protein n=1 Tax=Loa loa TaxID=7209 RepID=A0A1S0UB78_LOALO|nr:hypothetical protein LOAG_00461 [Loa loa]EFO28018.1 hypothetical protein LOAG_00461 [Loa loa]
MGFTFATFLLLLIYNILSSADIHLHPLLQVVIFHFGIIHPVESIRISGYFIQLFLSYNDNIINCSLKNFRLSQNRKFHLKIYLSSSSAIRIRILPRAVAYLNNIGAQILNEQLPRLSIPNIKQRINNGQGYVSVSRIRVSRYKQATEHIISTSAPNKITWIMRNLNMGLIGSLSGEVNILLPMKLEGEAEILAYGVNFQLESALEQSETGAARVSTIFCRTTIQLMNIEIYNGGSSKVSRKQ